AAHLLVVEDDRVLAPREDDIEVATADRILRPPPVDHAPFLADQGHRRTVHPPRRAVHMSLNQDALRRVQSSRGTSNARCSGRRDHGATSTTVQTDPDPVPART